MNDGTYVISLDEDKSIETYWIALHVNGDSLTYLESFGVKYILKEI